MIYVILFIVSLFLTLFIKKVAIEKSLVDIPNDRSSHTTPTPHGGGIAIAVTWFIGITYLYFTDDINISLYYALLVGIAISLVSYVDDLYDLTPKVRLPTQALVAIAGLYFLGGLEKIELFFIVIENPFVANAFAFLIIVWFVNLYNFLDGIDGYAGSEAVFLGLAGFLLFGGSHFLVLIAAVLGFLVWNWHKAKIFMGDVGSTLLGYNVAIFTIYYANSESFSGMWIWIILFGIFWFDATLTLFRRKLKREKLSQAHRKHAYQRLVQSGWAHDRVVLFSILVNAVLLGLIYFISNIFVAFFIAIVMLYCVVRFVDSRKKFE